MDSSFAFMASVHWPKATAQIAARFPSRVDVRDTNCLICSLNMKSSVSSRGSCGGVGLATLGVLGSRPNSEAKIGGILVRFGCVLLEGLYRFGVLSLVGLFVETAKNVSVHPLSVSFESALPGGS
jgi:hypothetical protein